MHALSAPTRVAPRAADAGAEAAEVEPMRLHTALHAAAGLASGDADEEPSDTTRRDEDAGTAPSSAVTRRLHGGYTAVSGGTAPSSAAGADELFERLLALHTSAGDGRVGDAPPLPADSEGFTPLHVSRVRLTGHAPACIHTMARIHI